MTFDEAMDGIRRSSRTAIRGGAGFEVGWRFGRPVMLGAGGGHIDYTPTRDDMTATDWQIIAGRARTGHVEQST